MHVPNASRHQALAIAMLLVAPAFVTGASLQTSLAATPQVAATDPVPSVDPRVPRAAGTPCQVELLHNRPWPQENVYMVVDPTITYVPPAACPPPWSKVILTLDVQTTRRSIVETLGMDLAHVRLFRSAVPRYEGLSRWHVERDLTDYSALFRTPHNGSIWSTQNPEAIDYEWPDHLPIYYASARLLFYPSTSATPAPRVPDAVIGVNRGSPVALPHNIVRAYVDVENGFLPDDPVWFTCVSDDSAGVRLGDVFAPGTNPATAINPPGQGCGGGSFRELKVRVDGTLAGIAPVFPMVIADLSWYHRNSANLPIPTLEMLNLKPYRVDLSPFAAVLSAAGPHDVSTGGAGTLLLYLDRNRPQVTGAVTLNTLATENGAPTDTNTVEQHGDSTQGDIRTREHRDFTIRGFVNTSVGRIDSSVHQTNDFSNVQAFHLEGPDRPDQYDTPIEKLYVQHLWLTSTAVQTSRRSQGTRLISRDEVTTRYPLELSWHMAATVTLTDAFDVDFHRTNITVRQHRVVDGDHYKPGFGHYTTHAGARFFSTVKGGDEQTDPRWESFTTRSYRDNFGSCYVGELDSRGGTVIGRSLGTACPDGRNRVRWFAHPDGSPESLGWWR